MILGEAVEALTDLVGVEAVEEEAGEVDIAIWCMGEE